MGVQLFRYHTAAEFLAAAGEALYARATINNLMLGICERLVRDPDAYKDPFFAALFDGPEGEVFLEAVMTPPHNMVLAGKDYFEKGLPTLIDYLQAEGIQPPGVTGPVPIVEAFADQWRNLTGQGSEIEMYQRVYELRNVRLPKLPEGRFRIAHLDEAPLVAEWIKAFEAEALDEDNERHLERANRVISRGDIFFWEAPGEVVSMAMKTRPLKNSITVSGVYTPPAHRRQGYASALVAKLSQHLLDMGYEFINLFTDLDNPTSNAIYQKIGYHPVVDFRMIRFREDLDPTP
jgi:hypothetical protein